jgi:integrase
VASIETKVVNGKPMHRARWRDPQGHSRRSKWYERKLDANRHRAQVEADLHRGAYVDMANPTTVAEYARAWVAARPLRERSKVAYGNLVDKHLYGTPLGGRPLVKVRPSEVQAWATSRTETLGPGTLRTHLGWLRSIFQTAVQDGLIARSPILPAGRLSLPKRELRPVVPLTVEQVQALAAEMPDRYRAMVVTQAGLGLRVSELLALRVEDVNFLRRTVHVEWQLELTTHKRVQPKTPKSRRHVPLPRVVAEALAEHLRAYPAADDGTLFTPRPRRGARPRMVGAEVPVSHDQYCGWLRKAASRAGLPATTSSHDLRHHYASVLLHAGEPVHAVAERLGHANPTLVLTTYGHLMPNQEDRTRRAIDAAWTAPVDGRTETG